MRMTPGERRALLCVLPSLVALLPPVTNWAAEVRARVFGIPFLVFWNASAILMTSVLTTVALHVKGRMDGPDGGENR